MTRAQSTARSGFVLVLTLVVAPLLGLFGCSGDDDAGSNDSGSDAAAEARSESGAADATTHEAEAGEDVRIGDGMTREAEGDGPPSDARGDSEVGDDASDSSCNIGTPTTLATVSEGPGLVTNAANVFFISYDASSMSIQSVPIGGGNAITLVTQPEIHQLAADAVNVYFTTPGGVYRCAIAGCSNNPSVVASLQTQPNAIVTNGTDVYYANGSEIRQCAVGGCGSSPKTFATVNGTPIDLATDGINIYWTNGVDGVWSCPVVGCGGSPKVIAANQNSPYAISSDGFYVYWRTGGTSGPQLVVQCPVNGCLSAPTILGPSWGNRSRPLSDGKDVYWGAFMAIRRCAVGGCDGMPTLVASLTPNNEWTGTVVAANATGFSWVGDGALEKCGACGCLSGPPRERSWIASTNNKTIEVAFDGTTAYWADQSIIRACSLDDCARSVRQIASGISVSNLLLADGFLYYADYSSAAEQGSLNVFIPAKSSPASRQIGGTLAGVAGTLVLQNNAGDDLTLSVDGTFNFPTRQTQGSTFSVSVASYSGTGVCTVAGGTGTVGLGDVSTITVNCATSTSSALGGTVSGLINDPIVLQINSDQISVYGNGRFAFPTPLKLGDAGTAAGACNLTVVSPPRMICTLSGFSGCPVLGDVSAAIKAICTTSLASANGPVSGLASDGSNLFWIEGGQLVNGYYINGSALRMPLTFGAVTTLATGISDAQSTTAVVSAQNYYFATLFGGAIYGVSVNGGSAFPVATGEVYPDSLLATNTRLFWATNTNIRALDLASDGGVPTSIAASGLNLPPVRSFQARRLAVDNGFLYWVGDTSVVRATLPGVSPAVLTQASLGGWLAGGIAAGNGQVLFSANSPVLLSVPE